MIALAVGLRAALIVVADIALWTLYQVGFGAPSGGFYWMAALCFVVVPIAGAVWAARALHAYRPAAMAAVFSVVTLVQLMAFVIGYAFLPLSFAVTNVPTPATCDGTYSSTAGRQGILLQQDTEVRVAAVVDRRTRTSTVYVIRRADGARLWSIRYPDDTVAAAINGTTVTVFHDAIGVMIDERTGAPVRTLVTIDSVGRNRGSFDMTGYFSIWGADGSVRLLEKLTFNGIQAGCFVDGSAKSIRKL